MPRVLIVDDHAENLYVLKVLLAGQGYPMIATHDPRLIEIASSLASRFGRDQGSYEFQMLYGIRPEEQRRLVKSGERYVAVEARNRPREVVDGLSVNRCWMRKAPPVPAKLDWLAERSERKVPMAVASRISVPTRFTFREAW